MGFRKFFVCSLITSFRWGLFCRPRASPCFGYILCVNYFINIDYTDYGLGDCSGKILVLTQMGEEFYFWFNGESLFPWIETYLLLKARSSLLLLSSGNIRVGRFTLGVFWWEITPF